MQIAHDLVANEFSLKVTVGSIRDATVGEGVLETGPQDELIELSYRGVFKNRIIRCTRFMNTVPV